MRLCVYWLRIKYESVIVVAEHDVVYLLPEALVKKEELRFCCIRGGSVTGERQHSDNRTAFVCVCVCEKKCRKRDNT